MLREISHRARSGSMEPAFRRGDILFLNNQDNPIRVGEVVVFKIKDRDIPIVHRVMKVHEKPNGDVDLPAWAVPLLADPRTEEQSPMYVHVPSETRRL